MTVVRFRVRLDDPAQADEVATLVEERLGSLEAVEEVQVAPAQPQAVGEIVLVVTGAVAIARGGLDMVAYVRATINELKALVEDWRDLKRTVLVEVDDDEVDVRDVGEAELEAIADDAG